MTEMPTPIPASPASALALLPVNRLHVACVLALLLGASGCTAGRRAANDGPRPADPDATAETRALYRNLAALAGEHVLFGHQDDLAYGVSWVGEPGRSDVRETGGAYPAVYGWELGALELDSAANIDGVPFADMQGWIREGYRRGGVITLAWHLANPVSGGSAWDTTRAVGRILPGGDRHEAYKGSLDRFARFVSGLRGDRGEPIPVIFRPFHEHTGHWFWWGRRHATPEEYTALWRFTVGYLRTEKGLHNLLTAYSPDIFRSEDDYLERYPGDDLVDVLGSDDYQALRSDETVSAMTGRLSTIVRLADARGKIAALTETGLEGVPDEDWWTNRLLRAIEADPLSRRVVYALVWRNANAEARAGSGQSTTHFFGPHPDSPSAPDFRRFVADETVMMEDDLPDLYRP